MIPRVKRCEPESSRGDRHMVANHNLLNIARNFPRPVRDLFLGSISNADLYGRLLLVHHVVDHDVLTFSHCGLI